MKNNESSNTLTEESLQYVDHESCVNVFSKSFSVTEDKFCASYQSGNYKL